MGWSFRKSKKLGPLRLTVSKSGLGVSVGGKAGRIGIGASGRTTLSAGVAGLRYQKVLSGGKHRPIATAASPAMEPSTTTGPDAISTGDAGIPLEALAPEDVAIVMQTRRLWWHRTLGVIFFLGGFALVAYGAAQGVEIRWAAITGSLLVILTIPWLLVTWVRSWWNNRKLRSLAERLNASEEV